LFFQHKVTDFFEKKGKSKVKESIKIEKINNLLYVNAIKN